MTDTKRGDRIRLSVIRDSYTLLEPGATGTVRRVDKFRRLTVNWDHSPSLLALTPDEDAWEIIGREWVE